MPDPNASFNTLATTTLQNYTPKLEDNISQACAVWYFLKEAGRIRTKTGGRSIVEPLLYAKNSTSRTYDPYETLLLTPQDGLSAAEFAIKAHSVTIAISGIEEAQNNGPEEVIDLLEAKTQQAEISCTEDFETMFQSDGTGNSGKNFLGLTALIGDQSSAVTTVGGINCATAGNEFWRSSIQRTAGVMTLTGLSTAYNNASRGMDKPEWSQTTQALFEKYESLLQPAQRFEDTKTAEAGFQNLTFKGKPVVWSPFVPAGTWTNVNSKYLRLNKMGKWMSATPFIRPNNQDARYSQLISYGNLSVSNRKLAGSRIEGLTA